MNDSSRTNANTKTAGPAFGCIALGIQAAGLVVAILMPYDNQGAVGKAVAALLTQIVAIPTALLGLLLGIIGSLRGRGFNKRLGAGLVASVAGLIPLAVLYVKYVA